MKASRESFESSGPLRPGRVESYRLVVIGVAGAVYGVGSTTVEATAFRAETLEGATARLASDGVLLDLSDLARAADFLAAIPGAPMLNLGATERVGRTAPLSDYLAYWAAAGARIASVS